MGDYLQNVYFSKLCYDKFIGIGLTNQMYSLTSSIIKALFSKKTAVAIDYFVVDYKENTKENISNIIDLKKTNEYLKQKYNIVLLDKNKMKFTLHKAYYGTIDNSFDITKEISPYISSENNSLCIPKNIDFNKLKGDPRHCIFKYFYLYYSLDEYNFIDTFNEKLSYDIMSHPAKSLCNIDFHKSICFIKCMPDLFNDILKNIHFIYKINTRDILYSNIFDTNNKINVIHLRVEDDALIHWGKQNGMIVEDFKIILENKYIELIEKYIKKDELTIIVSYSYENNVFNFLKNNNYEYLHVKKIIENKQREIDAIHDLLLSTKCNNVFIGNFYMKTFGGSSFSYYILQKLRAQNVKKVLINLDSIKDPEDVL